MSGNREIVLGIDGGGTHTRVMAVDLQGNILSYVEGGAASVKKDLNAKGNVQQAICEAVKIAGRELADVQMLAAGLAGIDSKEDQTWAPSLTELSGLVCPRIHINDAVIAQAGAFLIQPGIIVISGTGSIIFGINEDGRHIRNYDFHHYAESAARFLSYRAIYEILAGNSGESDRAFVEKVLHYWNVQEVKDLCALGVDGFMEDRRERDRYFGGMAPLVTKAAAEGSSVARSVCDKAVDEVVVGVELLGSTFASQQVKVALIGSVANSQYIKQSLTKKLQQRINKSYQVDKPILSSAAGAVLVAMNRLDILIDESIIANLSKHSEIPGRTAASRFSALFVEKN